ncbi:short-chain fatty acid transporter [Mycobacterium sp. CBMA293]|nr:MULTISPECIES: TIGR00366 family protein [unclassified Mycolicibacterium]MUL57579.1 short-chain fatty acid transporter [Mycolicibacterium sp. CBMA 335]MUL70619.1 short-chain fatty acid transporter [Mycolicibacterium sp. CBMA 311]MUM08320.1 short-chain fatty acid transporter [Mycolicibacterium sp. CBMA 213]MUM12250.1 short-chain fatty acid transporter [Mycolicibacterium sp. CBMA 293]MUL48253.1 short-chain fatty acid transporter [Mycolicibacterium sp. CBMA 360]
MATSEEPTGTSTAPKSKPERRGVMQSFTALCVRYVERLMPDPYLFAVILTLMVAGLVALLVHDAAPSGMLKAWYGGVWGSQNIFTFAFQMVLILVTGYTLAEAPVLKRAIVHIAGKPRNQVQGALLCFGVSAVLSLLNWGLGLVAGALVARQVAKRFSDAHFGYLIAAAFMGFIVWTQGFSSSIALANTDSSSPINVIHKLTGITVPLSQTIFQPYSWLSVIVLLVLLALTIWRMAPTQSLAPDSAVFEDEAPLPAAYEGKKTFAAWLENLWILNVLVFAAGMAYFVLSGFALNISSMIMLFTITSALLHRTPIRFIRAFTGAAKVSGPLLLQYPLYGGLVGLLGYQATKADKPLQTLLAEAVVNGATEHTLPFLTFVGSVIISLFVPSGGGHWAVQGPIAVDSALAIGQHSPAYLGLISMAVAVGEGVANMIQPFWLLPLLAIAKLNVRQVMGFTVVAFLIGMVVLGATTLIAPYMI